MVRTKKENVAADLKTGLSARFWGVRGTIPTPGRQTLRYGGNTSCIEIIAKNLPDHADKCLVLDAGSGLGFCGDQALADGKREFHIFLSHMHYDHIIGLTRFMPIFRKDCSIIFYGQAKCNLNLKDIIVKFFSEPFFPVLFQQLPAKISFVELNHLTALDLWCGSVEVQELNHPQGAYAYRFWDKNKNRSIVYATDHEHGTSADADLVSFAHGTDLFLYDSTYSDAHYPKSKGFGHSCPSVGAKLAKDAKVKRYGIFHHEPSYTDEFLENVILKEALEIFPQSFLCSENETIHV